MSFEIETVPADQFGRFERRVRRAIELAALHATDRAARSALSQIRSALPGRLKSAVSSGSDRSKGRGARYEGRGFSASGWLHVRGRSKRAQGALEAATEGAIITPREGKWLALPTGNIPKRVGRVRMTPDLYREKGFEERIGKLEFIPGRNGREALLVIRGPVTIDRFGRGRARRLPKRGAIGGSRKVVDYVVAFVLIKRTSRTPRVSARAILSANAMRLTSLLAEELKKEKL